MTAECLARPLMKSDELLDWQYRGFGSSLHYTASVLQSAHTDQITRPLWQMSHRCMFTGHLGLCWNPTASSFTRVCFLQTFIETVGGREENLTAVSIVTQFLWSTSLPLYKYILLKGSAYQITKHMCSYLEISDPNSVDMELNFVCGVNNTETWH